MISYNFGVRVVNFPAANYNLSAYHLTAFKVDNALSKIILIHHNLLIPLLASIHKDQKLVNKFTLE
jgi:hypothetical protein